MSVDSEVIKLFLGSDSLCDNVNNSVNSQNLAFSRVYLSQKDMIGLNTEVPEMKGTVKGMPKLSLERFWEICRR